MPTNAGTLAAKDASGNTQVIRADVNADGSLATHHVLETGGAVVTPTNPLAVADSQLGLVITNGKLQTEDANGAAYQGVVVITPGTPVPAARSLGFVCTAAGTLTMTLADGSTIALSIQAASALQQLPFAVTNVALSGGAAGTFWNLK